MKWAVGIAAAAALLVAAVILWPASKVALPPDAPLAAAPGHFHDSAPAGPRGMPSLAPDDPRVHATTPNGGGANTPNGGAPTPPPPSGVAAARGPIPAGAGSLSPDGG
jgi:hypothetical protein